MTTILGIDPGSRITGYAIIESVQKQLIYISSGCIRVSGKSVAQNLDQIFTGISEVIAKYHPEEAAIEQVFMHRNPGSALKLGQARGVAIVAAAQHVASVAEYSARQVKQAVVGYGAAKKEQVQQMVRTLLNLSGIPQADAADALAVAICHAHSRQNLGLLKMLPGDIQHLLRRRRGRVR